MRATRPFIFLVVLFCAGGLAATAYGCDIFIHGNLADTSYFDDLPMHVKWDSTMEIEDAAEYVAESILEQAKGCEDSPVVLRPHGYAASVVHYILGLGRRYANMFPGHDYVRVFKKTSMVVSYMGAYNGTPLMDFLCAGDKREEITSVLGEKCVMSMTTSRIHHSVQTVASPGVPIHLVYSRNSLDYSEYTGEQLSRHCVDWADYEVGVKNNNDSVVPEYSQRACYKAQVINDGYDKCDKIDDEFFQDFEMTKRYSHTGFFGDDAFLFKVVDDEKK
ncbi:MAG: hypothetical protein KAQ98_13205 [Bacteriovoracaceae bacterium]|nr:hypothetical protein [Bacteriovoracaceae bacterium]